MRRRVVVIGAGGRLGRQLVRAFREAGDEVVAFAHDDLDITSDEMPGRIVAEKPDVVVNAAAWTDVDGCARDRPRALAVNGEAAGSVARAAAHSDALLVQISTNEVFDGMAERPYRETDVPRPLNAYGESKLLGERLAADATRDHVVVRTAWLFGPEGVSFVTKIRDAARAAASSGTALRVTDDEWGNPTWNVTLADAIVQATTLDYRGVLHLAGTPAVTRLDWARSAVQGIDVQLVGISASDYPRASNPPLRAVLDTRRSQDLGLPQLQWRSHVAEVRSVPEYAQ